jgi:hypothetical protein
MGNENRFLGTFRGHSKRPIFLIFVLPSKYLQVDKKNIFHDINGLGTFMKSCWTFLVRHLVFREKCKNIIKIRNNLQAETICKPIER